MHSIIERKQAGPVEAEWRFNRGWSPNEINDRLSKVERLQKNFSDAYEQMTAENGWGEHFSEAVVGTEPPGPPEEGEAFSIAREAVARYAFSDPRIVTGYYDKSAPMLGRTMLLELKVLHLRYLCGVRISAVREESDAHRTLFGFRYDTLEGHIETGSEWFLLTKDHHTGLVHFRIQASWRLGTFPNWWSRLGFHLIGRRCQRAWHRLAYVRLREMTGDVGLPRLPSIGRIIQTGPMISNPGVVTLGVRHTKLLPTEHECAPN